MRRPLPSLYAVPTLALAVLLTGCAGGDPGADVAGAAEEELVVAAAADEAEPDEAGPDDADPQAGEPETGEPEDDATSVDLNIAPDPDPDMDAADYPDDPVTFERGRYEGSYGRKDYYEPSAVAQPGTMTGLRAIEAYRAGFALGLAEAQARDEERAAAREAGSTEEEDGPVGQVLDGWDAYSAATTYWRLDDPEPCDEAGPENPCLDTWYTVGNRSIVVVARLDATAGPEPRHALELRAMPLGYEVLQAWEAEEGVQADLPDWARDG